MLREIEFGVDIPQKRIYDQGYKADKYGLKTFPINGSRFYPLLESKFKSAARLSVAIVSASTGKQVPAGMKLTIRVVTENGELGVRIWRIK